MLKNYLTIGWRNLMKDKTFTLMNVIGLSVAFVLVILLSMAVFSDLSYDRFHEHGNRIYQVYWDQQTPRGPEAGTTQSAPFAEALKTEVPGVDKITRFLEDEALAIYREKELNLDAVWVDGDFFEMFTFPVLNGNRNDPLQEKTSVVITQNTAEKLFGRTEVLGETINILIDGKEEPFTVTAITGNNESHNSLEFEIAIPFENHAGYSENKENWNSQYHDVYVALQNGVSHQRFERNTRAFVDLHYKEGIEDLKRDGAVADADGLFRQLKLLPLQDVHFTSYRKGYADVSRSVPYLILGVAMLILFIACVNFINMSIAKSGQRLREIGMRKTLGAQKKQLFFQFWSESLLVFLTSVGIGILLSFLLLNDFNTNFQLDVSLDMLTSPWAITGFSITVLVITLLVGGYPALLLSRLGTIQSLKGKVETSGSNRVRNALMVLQFGIVILLISGTLVLWGQVEFMRNKDLGFDYKGRGIRTHGLIVDYDYLETLRLELVQGRAFYKNKAGDTQAVVINESMAKELGEEDPLTARLPVSDSFGYQVIGVVKDYHFQELSRPIEPLTFFLDRDRGLTYAYVKVGPVRMADSFDTVERTWKKIEPNAEFLGSFLDENVDRTFTREKMMATMITSGSIIAIALSCIGLFAMSLLIVAQRTKEIGVRKVLGASVSSITVLLTKDFLKLVLISFLIASPIAWWFLKEWLENYAYKVDLGVWFFLAAGLLASVIALLTVGTRTIKAAMQNPVKSLRTE